MSTHNARKKSKMGRPRVDSEELRARVQRPLIDSLDAWIAAQPEPRPSRSEAIRFALKDWLIQQGFLRHHEDPEGAN